MTKNNSKQPEPSSPSASILVVDDDFPVLESVTRILQKQGYEVVGVQNGDEALQLFRQHNFDLVISDLRLEGTSGLEVLRQVKAIDPDIPVLIMTGFGTMESAIEAVRLGASDYLTKPVRASELAMGVRNQLEALQLRRRVKELNREVSVERDRLRDAVAELNLLKRLSERMMSALSYMEGYELLLNFILEEIGADLAVIYDREHHQLRMGGEIPLSEERKGQLYQLIRQWVSSQPTGDSFPHTAEEFFTQVQGGEIFSGAVVSEEGGFASVISVPVEIEGRPFGLILAASLGDDGFEARWGKFLHQVARSASDFLTRVKRSVESQQYITSAIVEHISEGLIVISFTDRQVMLNPTATIMLKLPVGEKPTIEKLQSRLGIDLGRLWEELYSQGEDGARGRTIVRQVPIEDPDRTTILRMVVSFIPHTTNHGSMLISLHDITQEREVEEMKTRLVSNISHELRTPTAVVKEFLALLKDGVAGPLTVEQQQLVDLIKVNVDRLGRLVENLLTLARADTGGFTVVLRPERLEPIIEQVVASLTPKLSQKNIQLSVRLPSEIPLVYADNDAVIQILTNLIENARKYSPENTTVTLSVNVKGDRVEVSVADQGYGIPPSQIENIFKRFHRLVDQNDPRFQEGVGLGLPVVRDLVTRHGGDIWVESEVGKGSTFFFTLQIARGEEDVRPA